MATLLEQQHFRIRTDSGTADGTPTWGAGEDVQFNPGSAAFRFRAGIANIGDAVAAAPWAIYAKKNSGAYALVTTATAGLRSVDAGSSADETPITIPRLTYGDWQLPGSSVDLSFTSNHYYPTNRVTDYLSCSRASIGYAKNADGTLTQFGNDTLRIGVGTGLLVEDARTNICIYLERYSKLDILWNPT